MNRRKIKRRKPILCEPAPAARSELETPVAREKDRLRGTRRLNQSIEDPLHDWPESSGEPDRWLEERRTSRDGPDT